MMQLVPTEFRVPLAELLRTRKALHTTTSLGLSAKYPTLFFGSLHIISHCEIDEAPNPPHPSYKIDTDH